MHQVTNLIIKLTIFNIGVVNFGWLVLVACAEVWGICKMIKDWDISDMWKHTSKNVLECFSVFVFFGKPCSCLKIFIGMVTEVSGGCLVVVSSYVMQLYGHYYEIGSSNHIFPNARFLLITFFWIVSVCCGLQVSFSFKNNFSVVIVSTHYMICSYRDLYFNNQPFLWNLDVGSHFWGWEFKHRHGHKDFFLY